MMELSREEVKNAITEPIVKFAVYGDGKLLYVLHDDNLPRICSYISPALWEY